jgi:hypothetical protein
MLKGRYTIVATHKVTELQYEFDVRVQPGYFEVYIVSSPISTGNVDANSVLGHSWIEIVSHSAHSHTLGYYQLESFGKVTISKWKYVIDNETDGDFEGVWYNREIYEMVINDKYPNYDFTYEVVYVDKINEISSFICSTYDSYHLINDNCVSFSIAVWNICVDEDRKIDTLLNTPGLLSNAINSLYDHYAGDFQIIPASIDFGFYNGTSYINHTVIPQFN